LVPIACEPLNAPKCLVFGKPDAVHEKSLCTLDELAVLEGLLGPSYLCLEPEELVVASRGQPNRGLELTLVDRLGEVCADAYLDGAVDEIRALDSGDDNDRPTEPELGKRARRRQAVDPRHVDVEEVEVWLGLLCERQSGEAVVYWPYRFVSEAPEPLGQPERDDRIVFSDENAQARRSGET